MRDHIFVEEVVSKMLEYNCNEYLIDLDEIIYLNQYGNSLSNLISNIKNILRTELNDINSRIFNNSTNNIRIVKNSIKSYIFQILIFENGKECCLKLICK